MRVTSRATDDVPVGPHRLTRTEIRGTFLRGAMFTARLYDDPQVPATRPTLPFDNNPTSPAGPRPGREDNVIQMPGYIGYRADERAAMRARWHALRFNCCPIGAFVDPGYHAADGQGNPAVDFRVDGGAHALACMEELTAERLIPALFIGPDNWTTAQMRTLEPIFRQPRWQAVAPIVVPMGYEFGQDTPNADVVERFVWAHDVFPEALFGLHMVKNSDVPGNNDDLTPGSGRWIGPAACWQRLAPYLDYFFAQYGEFYNAPDHEDPARVEEFRKVFREQRFRKQIAGWPGFSASGPDQPILHVYAEGCSYPAYWPNLPQEACFQWGDIAVESGADGVLDGCH